MQDTRRGKSLTHSSSCSFQIHFMIYAITHAIFGTLWPKQTHLSLLPTTLAVVVKKKKQKKNLGWLRCEADWIYVYLSGCCKQGVAAMEASNLSPPGILHPTEYTMTAQVLSQVKRCPTCPGETHMDPRVPSRTFHPCRSHKSELQATCITSNLHQGQHSSWTAYLQERHHSGTSCLTAASYRPMQQLILLTRWHSFPIDH